MTVNVHLTGTSGGESAQDCLALFDEGASAADVALAHAMAQITLASGSWVSFAGILGMTYYEAATGAVHDLNAEYNTVADEDDPLSIPAMDFAKGLFHKGDPHFSGRTVLVPGFMAGVQAAHDRFGTLPFARIFDPSIELAENGFPFSAGLTQGITHRERVLANWPETRQLFTRADGTWLEEGDLFTQPELAETLRAVANKGAGFMYTGAWAQAFVDIVAAAGGKLTMADMAAYEPLWTTTTDGTYGDFTIHAHGAPATGGTALLEALKILEVSGIAKEHGHFTDSPEALYYLSQISRARLVDSLHGVSGVPDAATRLTPAHAERMWAMIQTLDHPMAPEDMIGAAVAMPADGPRHSDALVAVDAQGNICAITHSINCVTYGEFGRFVGGVSVPDSASFQQAAIAAAGAGKRLPSPLEVGIVTKGGKAHHGFASIGAGLHQKTMSCLYNVMEHGMTVEEAQATPSLGGQHHTAWSGENPGAQTVEADRFDDDLLRAAERNGITLIPEELMRGSWVAAQIDADGTVHGTDARISKPRGVTY